MAERAPMLVKSVEGHPEAVQDSMEVVATFMHHVGYQHKLDAKARRFTGRADCFLCERLLDDEQHKQLTMM